MTSLGKMYFSFLFFLDYADDISLLSDRGEQAQELLTRVEIQCHAWSQGYKTIVLPQTMCVLSVCVLSVLIFFFHLLQ